MNKELLISERDCERGATMTSIDKDEGRGEERLNSCFVSIQVAGCIFLLIKKATAAVLVEHLVVEHLWI